MPSTSRSRTPAFAGSRAAARSSTWACAPLMVDRSRKPFLSAVLPRMDAAPALRTKGQSVAAMEPTGPGHARRLASGSLAQQASQVAGLVAMLAIVTVLARRFPLAEFGV